jgi:hypothetical protein
LRAELEVVHAQTLPDGADGEVAVGVRLTDPSPRSRQLFGQYVLQHGEDAMLEELREAGLRVQSCSRAVEFGSVRSLDDYSKVLRLRKMAYIGASKLPPDAYTQDTADAFDKRARILLGHHRDQVVASMRLMFHGPADPMEHEQFVELPADLPPKQDLIEITRVCTHPGYRGGDLLFELFRHAIVTSIQSGRRWILGSSTPKLLGLYKRIGCQITDLRYNHEALAGEEHVIFIGDVHRALAGRGVNPLVWNAIFAPVWEYLDVPSFVQVSAPAKVRLAVYRGFGPLTRALARRAERRRSNKARS